MRKELQQLKSFLRDERIICSDIGESVFVDFRDANRRQEARIAKKCKELKIQIQIADKGALFS